MQVVMQTKENILAVPVLVVHKNPSAVPRCVLSGLIVLESCCLCTRIVTGLCNWSLFQVFVSGLCFRSLFRSLLLLLLGVFNPRLKDS
jgi:hypothetical protein